MQNIVTSWNTYFVAAMLMVILSWATSGCRWGNNTTTTPPPQSSQEKPDELSGYYSTSPSRLIFCVNSTPAPEPSPTSTPEPSPSAITEAADEESQKCITVKDDAIGSLVPEFVGRFMSDPVGFLVQDENQGEAVLFDPFGGEEGLPVYYDEDLSLLLSATKAPQPIWYYDECTHEFSITAEGQLNRTKPTTKNGVEISGSVDLNFVFLEHFEGDCAASTQEMEDCYFDHLTCGGQNEDENLDIQAAVRDFYYPYIRAKVMEAGQISEINAMGYEISYD